MMMQLILRKNFIIDESLFITFIDVAKNKGVLGSKSEIQNSKEWICIRLKALIARQNGMKKGFIGWSTKKMKS